MTFEYLLKQVNGTKSPSVITKILSMLEKKDKVYSNVAKEITRDPEDVRVINILRDKLYTYEYVADKKLEDLRFSIQMNINDILSATRAIYYYNVEWFSNQLLSIEAKQSLANQLIKSAGEYLEDEYILWNNIVDDNPDIIEAIKNNIDSI